MKCPSCTAEITPVPLRLFLQGSGAVDARWLKSNGDIPEVTYCPECGAVRVPVPIKEPEEDFTTYAGIERADVAEDPIVKPAKKAKKKSKKKD